MNNFEVIIGIEIHIELNTKTKMFSSSEINLNALPNTNVNQIDLGYPGTLPLVNKQAVKHALSFAKALNMEIDTVLRFDRKNYFYPDLPKGYQITQYFNPIGKNGIVTIQVDNQTKNIEIERIHLEEDTARQYHTELGTMLDYNRAGVPLIEIVTKPVIRSSNEAVAYVDMIRKIVQSLDISEGKLETGSLRADINISLRPYGTKKFGTKVEIKNMNSLSNIKKAIENDIKIQSQAILTDQIILQQTKRFDDQKQENIVMRTKTDTVDYRYFPEPNIPLIKLSNEFMNSINTKELPLQKQERYQKNNIQQIYINSLLDDIKLADYFDSIPYPDKEKLSKVFFAEIVSLGNAKGILAYDLGIDINHISQSIELLDKEVISGKSLKKLIPLLVNYSGDIDNLLEEHNLKQITDVKLINELLIQIINDNLNLVSEYPIRQEKVVKFVLGTLMKKTNGQVNPIVSNDLAIKLLNEKFK